VWVLVLFAYVSAVAGEIKIGDGAVTTVKLDGDEYVRLQRVVEALQGNAVTDDTTKKVKVKIGEHEIVFTPENNVVIIDKVPRNFPLPVRWLDDGLYIPIYFIDDLFLKPPSLTSTTSPKSATIESITWTVQDNTLLVTIKVNPAVHFETKTVSVKRYQLVIDASNKSDINKSFPRGVVQKLECKAGRTATIVFTLREEGDIRVLTGDAGLSVKIFGRPKRWVKRIVLDPGHGGYDAGAVGPTGLREKDCNLDIAKRLKGKLERELGVEVLMTRDRDVFVSLSARTEFANKHNAQLFISCHNNAAPSFAQTHGFETYFLSEARTTWARAVEQRENASIRFEMADTSLAHLNAASLILTDMAQNEFLRESSRMAELVQEAAAPYIGIYNRGINQAGFYVLRNAFMPAILIEGAFVSNRKEEQLLRGPEFRERMAEGISKGIKKFVYEYEQSIATK
jgi:N-acetylmuramoyl-L-alanine amidase